MTQEGHFSLDDARVREAANIAHRIACNDPDVDNTTPAEEVGVALARLVGRTLENFRQLDAKIRLRLRNAALVIGEKMADEDKLFGFLRTAIGNLKRSGKNPDKSAFKKIAIFLTGLIDLQEALRLKQTLNVN